VASGAIKHSRSKKHKSPYQQRTPQKTHLIAQCKIQPPICNTHLKKTTPCKTTTPTLPPIKTDGSIFKINNKKKSINHFEVLPPLDQKPFHTDAFRGLARPLTKQTARRLSTKKLKVFYLSRNQINYIPPTIALTHAIISSVILDSNFKTRSEHGVMNDVQAHVIGMPLRVLAHRVG